MKPKFGQIAVIGKSHASSGHAASLSPGQPVLASLVAFLHNQGCEVVVEKDTAAHLGANNCPVMDVTGIAKQCDLALVVGAAYKEPLLRELSTSPGREVDIGRKTLQYNNTNRLVKSPDWDIGLQKTGYISEAGQCLVMQTKVAGRKLIMVFLDSAGKLSRIADAERVRRWLESAPSSRASVHQRNHQG